MRSTDEKFTKKLQRNLHTYATTQEYPVQWADAQRSTDLIQLSSTEGLSQDLVFKVLNVGAKYYLPTAPTAATTSTASKLQYSKKLTKLYEIPPLHSIFSSNSHLVGGI